MNLLKPSTTLLATVMLLAASLSLPAQNADEIIALTKAQWAAENQSKPASEAWTSIADDYTEFNPMAPTLVEGKALAARFYTASLQSTDTSPVSEMLNPNVQFYGDTAILTYNYAGMTRSADGKMTPNLAKSTRVYVKQNGRWMLVHANFAPVIVPGN